MSGFLKSAVALWLVASSVAPSAYGADGATEERSYVIPFHGTIVLDVPRDWVGRREGDGSNAPPTLRFEPKSGEGFTIALTVVWDPERGPGFNEPEALRGMVENAIESLRETAKEGDIPVQEIREASIQGYYFSITDKAEQLPPGEFRYLTQGALALDDLLVSFSILTQPETQSIAGRALQMLRGISRPSERSKGR